MQGILSRLLFECKKGNTVALATVVFQEGSAPRGTGARLIAGKSGLITGTTGGGLAEAMAMRSCAEACGSGKSSLIEINMTGTLAAHSDLICGGIVKILIEPFLAANDSLETLLQQAANAKDGCIIIRPLTSEHTAWTLLFPDGHTEGESISDLVINTIQKANLLESLVISVDGISYFCERCSRKERMFIAGGGHVSRPTAEIARLADFDVYVFDDREEFANQDRFPNAQTYVIPDYKECFKNFEPDSRDYIVIVTRGHMFDGVVCSQALQTSAGYIGMIGSSTKKEQIYASLREQGFTEQDIARIHSPIGLSICAETPEEIAVSILAECIASRRKAIDILGMKKTKRHG